MNARIGNKMLTPTASFGGERRETFWLPDGDGQHLAATLHRPAENPPSGIRHPPSPVLLLPGWSGPRTGPAELLVFLARRLCESGRIVLRLDFHGRGDSSGGFEETGLDRMIADASRALDYLQPLTWAGDHPPAIGHRKSGITVGGICSGANVALGLASLRPGEVGRVLALSALPFQPARTAAFERRRRWKNIKQYAAKALRPATWARLLRGEVNLGRVKENVAASERKAPGERNLKDSARDIEAELSAWKGRVCFIWGGGDEEAALSKAHFEKLHAKGGGGEARFDCIAGANHNFYGKAWRADLAGRVLDFLRPAAR